MRKNKMIFEKEILGDFGKRIKKIRKDNKLTQVELAKEVGLHQIQLSNYENGIRKPNDDHAGKIAAVLNTDVDYLLYGDGEFDMEDTSYGCHLDIKHVTYKDRNRVELSSDYQTLSNDGKKIVNEVIELLSKKEKDEKFR